MRRIITSHVAYTFRQQFATHVWPYNWAVGVRGGMDFVIKSMQLATEKYIKLPQARGRAPTRAAVFLDLKNMFNLVSRDKLLKIIQHRYP